MVYVAAEGAPGLRNPVAAFKKRHNVDGVLPIALVPSPIDLHDAKADVERLAKVIAQAVERYGEAPAPIAVDAVSKTMGAGKDLHEPSTRSR